MLLSVCKCRTRYWIFIRHVTCDLEHHTRIHYQFSCINFQIFYTSCATRPLIIPYYCLLSMDQVNAEPKIHTWCNYVMDTRCSLMLSWNPIGTWCFQTPASGCHTGQAMAPHCILEGLPSAANNSRLRCVFVYSCKSRMNQETYWIKVALILLLCYVSVKLL